MRIGLLSNPDLVNSNYRVYQPLMAVARRGGHELVHNSRDSPLSPHTLLGCDVVHVHRIATEKMRALARQLRAAGVGVVWDDDDDVSTLPRWNPHYRRMGAAGRRAMVEGVREMVRLADVVTTPSAHLADKFRELGATDVRVLENRLPSELLDVKPIKHDGVVVACLASLEHHVDYERLRIAEVLEQLLDDHPELRVVSLGLGLGLSSDRYTNLKKIPFLELTRELARADIGLAPLVDIPWNRARSNVKLKEYTAAGLAWLASPVGPYVGMGESQGGRLVPDDGWHEAIERLVVDRRARRKLAKRGAKWAKHEHVDRHAKDWEAALRDAAQRGRDRATGTRAA